MRVMKHAIFAMGLAGGAMVLSAATPASAATLTPALDQIGDWAAVEDVRHDFRGRPGRLQGERYWQQKNSPGDDYWRRSFRRSGPAVGFGLSVPGFSFGVGVPSAYYGSYGYGYPYGYGYGYRRW